ncbi:MAG: ABC transporter transmembrane domain-containing protein, partial [Candidatus Thorarchaeota archaeon]
MKGFKASWQLFQSKPKYFFANFSTQFLFSLTPLATALVLREFFNTLEGTQSWGLGIWMLILILPATILLQCAADLVSSITFWICYFRYPVLLGKNMLTGVLDQPGAYALEKSSGEAVSRFRGDIHEASLFGALLGFQLALGMYAVIAFMLMYAINSVITIFVFVPFTLITAIVAGFRHKVTKFRERRRKAAGKVTGTIGEMFGAIQAIKVSSAEGSVLKYFKRINDERRSAAVKDETLSALLGSIGEGLARIIGIGIMLLMVGSLMQVGQFSVGDFAFFIFLMDRVIWFVLIWGQMIPQYHKTNVSYKRMIKLMQGKDESYPEENLLRHGPIYLDEDYPPIQALERNDADILDLLETKNLSFTYPNSENGIHDASIKIKQGSFTVITGRIGSGKTTLLRTLLGLLPKQNGEI